jgi:hypothetical protein
VGRGAHWTPGLVSCPRASAVCRCRDHFGAAGGSDVSLLASRLVHLEAEELLDLVGEADDEQDHNGEQRRDDEPEPGPGPARATPMLDPRTAARAMEAVRAPNGVGIDRWRLRGRMVFQLLSHETSVRP